MLLGLVLGVGGAHTVNAQEELLQELKTVGRVHLAGRHKLSAGAIRKVLKTRPVSIWPWRDRPALRFDYLRADVQSIRDLYRHNGYLDADATYSVTPTRKNNQVEVTFTIHEGPITHLRAVQFEGVAVYPLKDLRKKVWSRPGRIF
jgi:outer membrane protein assembly factor BamA